MKITVLSKTASGMVLECRASPSKMQPNGTSPFVAEDYIAEQRRLKELAEYCKERRIPCKQVSITGTLHITAGIADAVKIKLLFGDC